MPHFQLAKPRYGIGQGANIKLQDFDWRKLDFKWLTKPRVREDIFFSGKPIVVNGRGDIPHTHWVQVVHKPYKQKMVVFV